MPSFSVGLWFVPMNEIIDTLLRHRSIRTYADGPVRDEDILRAVAAGQAASTSSAVQAYCLIRVRDPETREHLAQLTGPQEKVAKAGAFFVICGDTRRHRLACARDGLPYDAKLEAFLLSVIDATLFAQNLVVAFESMGYGICYIGALRNQLFEADAALALPQGVFPLYGLCVGVPAEEPLPRPRLDPQSVLFEEHYPDDQTILAQLEEYDTRYRDYLRGRGAEERDWSAIMARKFSQLERVDLGAYYRSKGANLD